VNFSYIPHAERTEKKAKSASASIAPQPKNIRDQLNLPLGRFRKSCIPASIDYMFGKHREKYVKWGGIILAVVVILSMIFYTFALTF
jgi:hypothetical protein